MVCASCPPVPNTHMTRATDERLPGRLMTPVKFFAPIYIPPIEIYTQYSESMGRTQEL